MLERADETALSSWQRLARQVRDDLAAAGLPVPAGDLSGEYRAGAVVEVNPSADADGGVWVFWKAHPHLSQAAARAVQEGRLDDPVIKRSGRVAEIMQAAMMAILRSEGYQVEDLDWEYRPYHLRVVSAG